MYPSIILSVLRYFWRIPYFFPILIIVFFFAIIFSLIRRSG